MTEEKWDQISLLIKDKFEVLAHDTEELDPGELEYFEFEGPLGKMRLERTIRPKTEGSKMHTSTRIGAEGREEIIYSETETVSFINAFKWSDDLNDWQEIEAGEDLFD